MSASTVHASLLAAAQREFAAALDDYELLVARRPHAPSADYDAAEARLVAARRALRARLTPSPALYDDSHADGRPADARE